MWNPKAILGYFGGLSRSERKQEAARKNLPRPIVTSSPERLVESLGEEGPALEALFKRTKAEAHPFPDYRGTAHEILTGNVNACGLLPCVQICAAKQRLQRLDLPQEAEDAALRFIQQFVYDGMGVPFGCDIRPGSMRAIESEPDLADAIIKSASGPEPDLADAIIAAASGEDD